MPLKARGPVIMNHHVVVKAREGLPGCTDTLNSGVRPQCLAKVFGVAAMQLQSLHTACCCVLRDSSLRVLVY